MHKPAFQNRPVELLFVWIIPTFILLASFGYWWWQGKVAFFGYLYVMPIVFIAIFVNIATDHLNLWRWKTTILSQYRLIYRPVVYAIYYNLAFMLGAHLLTAETTLATVIESAIVIGFVGMMVGVLFDLFTLDTGFISVTKPQFNIEKYGTIVVLSRYAFRFFASIALAGGVAAKIGHYYLYEVPNPPLHWLPLAVLAGIAISPPFVWWAYANDSRDLPEPDYSFGTPYSIEPLAAEERIAPAVEAAPSPEIEDGLPAKA